MDGHWGMVVMDVWMDGVYVDRGVGGVYARGGK